ncbi:hypothetical protein C7999DRAFT_36586 [Corynascus novoguineensis]|uniref:Uncharacterized protein n=1 Tax=Corynascus novoguineensis TaxID=1126955 RepID=A0AAN7CJ78_9PEZI|nr:hypothetical protein C7999DRAFT_36586 [Corynascus novoguineensis]
MPEVRPPRPLAAGQHYNSEFIRCFTEREEKPVKKQPAALTAEQRALRNQLQQIQFLSPDYVMQF